VRLPDGRVIEYVIDARNRRIGRKIDGVFTQRMVYSDELRPAAEVDDQGEVVTRFVYATNFNVPDLMIRGDQMLRVVTDHLGSVRMVVDVSTGEVLQRIDYDEFGRVLTDTNPGFQPFGFAGGLYDADTGLVRFGARDYDAYTGRWTAKDPLGFGGGGTNLYEYVFSDPVNHIDPYGLSSCDDFVKNLVDKTKKANSTKKSNKKQKQDLAKDLLDSIGNKDVAVPTKWDGFRKNLTSGGQNGEVYRHIGAAAGVHLAAGDTVGSALILAQNMHNWGQAIADTDHVEQSKAEIRDNAAGKAIGNLMEDYIDSWGPNDESLTKKIHKILCECKP
jgi:RHS repeat-associated protein